MLSAFIDWVSSVESPEVYDTIITTFSPLGSIYCGAYYKKRYPSVKWLCDFRDPAVVKAVPFVARGYMRYVERSACRKADAIIAVSNGYLERICGKKHRDKAYMIPNGYDPYDSRFAFDVKPSTQILTITYAGYLYGGKRDLSPMFRALAELIGTGEIDRNRIKVEYAGIEFNIISAQAKKYGLDSILHNNGLLSREECLKLQFSSHMLILSTWNEKGEYGVFPGKFLEYMLIGKPILSITNGDLPNSEVTNVMREGNFGIAYEAACDATDYYELRDYLKRCYDEWLSTGRIAFAPKEEVLQRYNYQNIVKRFENLICGKASLFK